MSGYRRIDKLTSHARIPTRYVDLVQSQNVLHRFVTFSVSLQRSATGFEVCLIPFGGRESGVTQAALKSM